MDQQMKKNQTRQANYKRYNSDSFTDFYNAPVDELDISNGGVLSDRSIYELNAMAWSCENGMCSNIDDGMYYKIIKEAYDKKY